VFDVETLLNAIVVSTIQTDNRKIEMKIKELAERMYISYGQATGFRTFQGHSMLDWDDLPQKIQNAWIAAAKEAIECQMYVDIDDK